MSAVPLRFPSDFVRAPPPTWTTPPFARFRPPPCVQPSFAACRALPGECRVINVMNAIITAVDCACTALMIMAAGFDEDETSTFNDVAFVLQLAALIGK